MVSKRDIINISLHLFSCKGFHETTMENIADALGLKKQSIYSHFKSKNEIIACVLKEQAEQINAEIEVIIAEYCEKPVEMLLKFIFTRLVIFLSRKERLLLWKRIFLLEMNGELRELLEQCGWTYHRRIQDEIGPILRSRYQKFASPERLDSFFLSYTIFTQGYLDLMLLMGYDVNTLENAWQVYWSGAKSYFS
jgi:AcrR family transcriptional regulator